jgi:2-C-methyl-D-erythritol 4-phosphate cytidylyltransferase
MSQVYVVLAAAGKGRRLEAVKPKQYLPLRGKPILAYSLLAFERHPGIDGLILVVGAGWEQNARRLAEKMNLGKLTAIVTGGARRQESVYRGLLAVPKEAKIVLIHDAARPLVKQDLISRLIAAGERTGAAVPHVPLNDTVKLMGQNCLIERTLERNRLLAAQTPQAFNSTLILEAHEKARADNFIGTDDAVLVERLGLPVEAVSGQVSNFKITTEMDYRLAQLLMESKGEI